MAFLALGRPAVATVRPVTAIGATAISRMHLLAAISSRGGRLARQASPMLSNVASHHAKLHQDLYGKKAMAADNVGGINRSTSSGRNLGRVRWLVALATAAVGLSAMAYAVDLPDLLNTRLYRELAHNCHPVDLTTWNHPTKQVLEKYHVKLYALEICNSDTYPIFHVDFDFDPMGSTDSFFVPFYNAMFSANFRNPMAFVETKSGNAIVMISNDHGRPSTSYEQYKS